MGSADKSVFISYRRGASKLFARSLFLDLNQQGFDPFLDVETIGAGEFESVILTEIAARPHFLFLVSPGSLERCRAEGDWLRREYEEAARLKRNIVPVIEEGQTLDALKALLPPSMRGLFGYNAVMFHHDLWSGSMNKLCGFLKPVSVALRARSATQTRAVERKIAAARAAEGNSVGMEFAGIEPGVFWMGSPEDEAGRSGDETRHLVKLTRPFEMTVTPVTQGQWRAVMGTSLWSQAQKAQTAEGKAEKDEVIGVEADDYPMYYVNWEEAEAFCRQLTEMEHYGGLLPESQVYRLPTEAEWEYACRAGTATATYAGDLEILGERNAPVLDPIAWYGGNSSVGYEGRGWDSSGWPNKQYPGGKAGPRRVGTKAPNAWGLYDMIGNVNEWCADWYGPYAAGSCADPTGPKEAAGRVFRGGGWSGSAGICRSAFRFCRGPGFRGSYLGFRPVRSQAGR